jgi:hypothetical protein
LHRPPADHQTTARRAGRALREPADQRAQAASLADYAWPEYPDMIGGFMDSEHRPAPITLTNDDSKLPCAIRRAARFYDDIGA